MVMEEPADVKILTGFISMNDSQLIALRNEMGLAMSEEDLKFCQEYFAKEENVILVLLKFALLILIGLTIVVILHLQQLSTMLILKKVNIKKQ